MQLVMHVAGFAAVVAEIEACFITGEVHRQQRAAHLQLAAAQLKRGSSPSSLSGEALERVGIAGGQHMGVAVEGAGEVLSQWLWRRNRSSRCSAPRRARRSCGHSPAPLASDRGDLQGQVVGQRNVVVAAGRCRSASGSLGLVGMQAIQHLIPEPDAVPPSAAP